MSREWIPQYIRQTIQYKPNEILTAQDYNAILNLLISQGDYSSEWLDYLQTEGIDAKIEEAGMGMIQTVLTAAVRAEIDALAASVINKVSRQLNNPNITVLNIGQQINGIAELDTLVRSKNMRATYAIASSLVGSTGAYPTLTQLNTLYEAGNDIVAYSTDAAIVTTSNAEARATATKAYMTEKGFNTKVFVYPKGSISDHTSAVGKEIMQQVLSVYDYAVNVDYEHVFNSDGFMRSDAIKFGDIPVIPFDINSDVDTIKDYIDEIMLNNFYMILMVDTDGQYNPEGLATVLDYINTKTGLVKPTRIDVVANEAKDTVGNLLHDIFGIYITKDASDRIVLNW